MNLDFDHALSANDPKLTNDKVVNELEYIFFLSNSDIDASIFTKKTYSQSYLNHLKDLGFTWKRVVKDCVKPSNWWGNLDSFDLALKFNSKCWLASWHNPVGEKLIETIADLDQSFPSYYRADHGFSGIHNRKLASDVDFRNLKFPGVQAKLLDIVQTFGVTVNLDTDEYYLVENFVNKRGNFLGGRIINEEDLLLEFDLKSIFDMLRSRGLIGHVQFDNAIYRQGRELRPYPLMEINYRRTMGNTINNISKILGPGSLYFGDKSNLKETSVLLSPNNVKNICYFNRA